jgi:hypothetical protein
VIKQKPGFGGRIYCTLEIPFRTGFTLFEPFLCSIQFSAAWRDTFHIVVCRTVISNARDITKYTTAVTEQQPCKQTSYHVKEWTTIRDRCLYAHCLEPGLNTCRVALQIVRGDEMGTQCLGICPGHPVPGTYKYNATTNDYSNRLRTLVCNSEL